MEQSNLFDSEHVTHNSEPQPVICLGIEFASDEERRQHFTELLRKRLRDPEFRKIEGFPIGSDEDILNLSDPPYYTACPNPWISDFIAEWEAQKPEQPENYQYHREPFATDVSEGKNDPIYNAHSYHTKVPHKAIMRYILHYTEPGDIVFDGFCGTGMTGVAAQMCGDRDAVLSLGYQVKPDGTILQEEVEEENGNKAWRAFSKLGARKAVLNDLSPAATFIAYNYNTPVDILSFKRTAKKIISDFEKKTKWMWETLHTDRKTLGKVNYIVWSDVYSCPECSGEIIYYKEAFIKNGGAVEFNPEFNCPHCNCSLSKKPPKNSQAQKPARIFESAYDPITRAVTEKQKQVPVLINYSIGTRRHEKLIDSDDLLKATSIDVSDDLIKNIPFSEIIEGDKSADPFGCGIRHVHEFYTKRILASLSILADLTKGHLQLEFLVGSMLPKLTIMNRYMPQHGGRALVGPMANTLYVPPVSVENNVIDQLVFQYKKIIQALTSLSGSVITTQAAQSVDIQNSSIDYIFLDPPFGSNIMYSELSYIRESWLRVITNNKPEAIENKTQKKGIDEYRDLMTNCFEKAFKYLKPGRWMTVEFSNTKASVWNSIQNAISDAGFIVATVAALDKTRGGLHAMLGPTAVKQDLVISAYKPNGGFEKRFQKEAATEEGVWDFIRTHLKYLPVIKEKGDFYFAQKSAGESIGQMKPILERITERDPRILYDQLVAFYVRKGLNVQMNSQDFQKGLAAKFIERDGMYFLPEQAAKYDQKKAKLGVPKELFVLFVCDESSAIQWLRQLIREKPQTFAEINPQFMQQLGGWRKNEAQLDLRELLNQNFLCYDGKGKIPSQIVSWMRRSSKLRPLIEAEFKAQGVELSENLELETSNQVLRTRAQARWYIPDPNKAGDLEKMRERALLKEFEEYRHRKGKFKRGEKFRLEAVRTGFKKAWQEHDYAVIIAVADKIPNIILEEDPNLLMWYDQAITRMGDK